MVTVQSKFDQFVLNVASVEDQESLNIENSLGNGVYVLVTCRVVAATANKRDADGRQTDIICLGGLCWWMDGQ